MSGIPRSRTLSTPPTGRGIIPPHQNRAPPETTVLLTVPQCCTTREQFWHSWGQQLSFMKEMLSEVGAGLGFMEARVPFMGFCLLSGHSILFLLGEDPLRGTSPTASGLKLLDTVGGFQSQSARCLERWRRRSLGIAGADLCL